MPPAQKGAYRAVSGQGGTYEKGSGEALAFAFKRSEGGYGKAAAESGSESLLSVKIAAADIRIVYKLIRSRDGESALVIFASAVNDASPRSL